MYHKTVLPFLFLLAAFLFSACSNSELKKDAQQLADIECESKKILERAGGGDLSAIEDNLNLARQLDSLRKEIDRKYVSEGDKVKFAKELVDALANCK
jgi:hypothetical protein